MIETYTTVRKVKLLPVGDLEEINRVYKYISNGCYAQNKAYNIQISTVYSAMIAGASKDTIKELHKRGQRIPKEDNPNYSLYKYGEIVFPKGMQTQSTVTQRVKADIQKSIKDGLLSGKVSLPTKKMSAPLLVESQQFSFYYPEENLDTFQDNLFTNDCEIYMKFVNGIVFKVVLGNPYKSHEIRCVFQNIFNGTYKVSQSSLQIIKEKKGKKKGNKKGDSDEKVNSAIIMNICLQIPKEKKELDENTVVGIDVGVAIPAACALNNNKYKRLMIGSAKDFLRIRTKLQKERKKTQAQLRNTNGGHGRARKLRHLECFKKREENFVTTYCHMISSRVIDFALKNHAKYINLEDLGGYDANDFFLRNWSYYKMQNYIKQKADRYGIVVRKINPYHTSQVCSCCGHYEEGQRVSQSEFVCKNPECESHSIYKYGFNADFNAARNIAMSTSFVDEKAKKNKRGRKVDNQAAV